MAAQAAIQASLRQRDGKCNASPLHTRGQFRQETLLKLAWMAACAAMTLWGEGELALMTGIVPRETTVIPALVAGIQPDTKCGVRGQMDPGESCWKHASGIAPG